MRRWRKACDGWTFLLGDALGQIFPETCLAKDEMPRRRGQASTSCPPFKDMMILEWTEILLFLCASVGPPREASRTWSCLLHISMGRSYVLQRVDSSGHLSSWTLTLHSPGAGGHLLPTKPPQAVDSLESYHSGTVSLWDTYRKILSCCWVFLECE